MKAAGKREGELPMMYVGGRDEGRNYHDLGVLEGSLLLGREVVLPLQPVLGVVHSSRALPSSIPSSALSPAPCLCCGLLAFVHHRIATSPKPHPRS